jgi:RimJ/RimL family protein N-acetyltransferase
MTASVHLRDVAADDLLIFFEQQRSPEANLMAAFPARDRDAFFTHWTTKILADETVIKKTVLFENQVAGNILSWQQADKRLLGYWIGKEFWGKGVATKALSEFLTLIDTRPLHAYVAEHNMPSIRVLEKCGFTISNREKFFSEVHGRDFEELLFVLK